MRKPDWTRAIPYVGCGLAAVGVILILLGWHGAAHTPLVFEQVPYLISGGQLGTALVLLGALVSFGFWLGVVARDQRETHRLLRELLLQGNARSEQLPSQRDAALVRTAKGDMVHRADCPVVRGRDDLIAADNGSGRPCGICQPAAA